MDFYKQIHNLENSCTVKIEYQKEKKKRKNVIEEKESQFKLVYVSSSSQPRALSQTCPRQSRTSQQYFCSQMSSESGCRLAPLACSVFWNSWRLSLLAYTTSGWTWSGNLRTGYGLLQRLQQPWSVTATMSRTWSLCMTSWPTERFVIIFTARIIPPLSWKQRLEICIGAARGPIQYG
jgi:hypothetical protein